MTGPPPSIPEQIEALTKRMQRIEDAVTAKGIKFIDKRENWDWLPAAKVMDYVYELVGIRFKWRNVYNWIHLGLIGRCGKRVYLKYETASFRSWFVRKLWVREFLDKVRKGII